MRKLALVLAWMPFFACLSAALYTNDAGGQVALAELYANIHFRLLTLSGFIFGACANAYYVLRFAPRGNLVLAAIAGLGTLVCPCWPLLVVLLLVLPTRKPPAV